MMGLVSAPVRRRSAIIRSRAFDQTEMAYLICNTAGKQRIPKQRKGYFDPVKMPQIIDSLKAGRDATFTGLTAASQSLEDSLAMPTQENEQLKAKLDSLSVGGDKSRLITELNQLKELLDSKIITQAEYDAKKKIAMDKWQ